MDDIILALCFAIAIVLVLLWTCKKQKAAPHKKPVMQNALVKSEPKPEPSTFGSGVVNKQQESRYNDLASLSGYDDYNAVIQYESLEPELYDSHERYSKDMGRSTTGSSAYSIRDDRQDVVPRVGLRLTDYKSVSAGPGARQEHSEYVDQMPEKATYCF